MNRAVKISRRSIASRIARQECTFDITNADHLALWRDVFHGDAECSPENVLSPVCLGLYVDAHVLQLRSWVSAIAYKTNADMVNASSPILAAETDGNTAAAGTVAPLHSSASTVATDGSSETPQTTFLQHGMLPLALDHSHEAGLEPMSSSSLRALIDVYYDARPGEAPNL